MKTLLARHSRLALALSAFVLWARCASAPKPPIRPPDDPALASLAETFHLDDTQKQKTGALLREFRDRNTRIRENWEKRFRIRPEELLASEGLLRRDFLAILTVDQRRVYSDFQLLVQAGGQPPARPGRQQPG